MTEYIITAGVKANCKHPTPVATPGEGSSKVSICGSAVILSNATWKIDCVDTTAPCLKSDTIIAGESTKVRVMGTAVVLSGAKGTIIKDVTADQTKVKAI